MKRSEEYSDHPSTSSEWKPVERNGQMDHSLDCQSPSSFSAKFHPGGVGPKPSWKLLLPSPIEGDVKTGRLFRVAGTCKEKPEHNVRAVKDPRGRNWHRPAHHGGEHLLPTNFIVDDDYNAVPTKREVAITGLNDNADERFIRGLFKCGGEPTEVVVYHHPVTKRHLRMAHIGFKTFKEAAEFVKRHDGKPMMGNLARCFFDPLCYRLSQLYQQETNQIPPMPQRYNSLKSTRAINRLRELCRRLYDTDSPQPVPLVRCDSRPNLTPVANSLRQEEEEEGDTTTRRQSTGLRLSRNPANGCAKKSLSQGKMENDGNRLQPSYATLTNGHRAEQQPMRTTSTNDCEIIGERKPGRMTGSVGKKQLPKASLSSPHSVVECIELPPSPPRALLASPPPPPPLPPPNFGALALSPAACRAAALPPPALIDPPKPVGMESSDHGLERRLAMIFGAKREPTTPAQPSQAPENEGSSNVETKRGVGHVAKSSSHEHAHSTKHHRTQWGDRKLAGRGEQNEAAWPQSSLSPPVDAPPDRGIMSEEARRIEMTITYNDVRCRVKNIIAADLRTTLHRDFLKRLEAKAFSVLDSRYHQTASSGSRAKGGDSGKAIKREPLEEHETTVWENRVGDSRDQMTDASDELGFKSLFGFHSHRERMASLPSFKKKPVDQRKLKKERTAVRKVGASSRSPTSDECIYLGDEGEELAPAGSETRRRSLESVSSLNASRISSDAEDTDGEGSELWSRHEISRRRADSSDSVAMQADEPLDADELSIISRPLPKIPRLSTAREKSAGPTEVRLGSESPLRLPTPTPEPLRWAERSDEEVKALVHSLESEEISAEDARYLEKASSSTWDMGLPGPRRRLQLLSTSKPRATPRVLESPVKSGGREYHFDDAQLAGIVPHKSGCARTEGYYSLSKQRKRMVRHHEDFNGRTVISEEDLTAIRCQQQALKLERSTYRRLATSIGDSTLLKVNQLKYRKKMLKFSRSRIHGWGLYALEEIQPDAMIIEYVGEVVRPTVADERERNYERRGMGSSYMFRIDDASVIDATVQGNFGRFINHSCAPNCTARVVIVDGDKRIVIYSKRLIGKGEEITYDYKFAREDEASKIECLCGARNCQKFLN